MIVIRHLHTGYRHQDVSVMHAVHVFVYLQARPAGLQVRRAPGRLLLLLRTAEGQGNCLTCNPGLDV